MRLEDYARLWFATLPARYRPNTVTGYRSILTNHVLPKLGKIRVGELGRQDIRGLLALLLSQRLEPATVHMAHAALSSLLTSAEDDGLIATNPAHGAARRLIRRSPVGEPRAPRPGEFTAFLEASRKISPHLTNYWLTLLHLGLRPGEALGLAKTDLRLEEKRANITRTYHGAGRFGPTKGGRARLVPLNGTVVRVLEAQADRAEPPDYWLFSALGAEQPYSPKHIQTVFQRVRREAGIRRYLSPHSLRHGTATWLIERGAREVHVQKLLGHRSIAMTVDLYARGAELPPIVHLLDREKHGPASASQPPKRRKEPA